MNFIRENLLKIIVIIGVVLIVIIGFASCSTKKPTTVQGQYEQMEQNMVNAAKNLANQSSTFLPKEVGSSTSIKLSTMVKNEQISELYAKEDNNVICSGYVLIQKKEEKKYNFIPHLKCGKYYETKTLADYILDNEKIVTADDGLYQNGAGYIYRGENPNNYLMLDDKIFRIISITSENQVKVIAQRRYDSAIWDDRYNALEDNYYGINIYDKSRLKDYLEEIYNDEEYFSPKIRNYIVPHDICVGKRSEKDDGNISGTVECSAVSNNQYIGLINTSEYLKASIDTGCISGSNYDCGNYNYFSNISAIMGTITASADDTYEIYFVSDGVLETKKASSNISIFPTFYIDANILYKSGNGTETNPYTLR